MADESSTMSFPGEEQKTLEYWKSLNAFETSLKLSQGRPEFTFYDGPPFATGLPHYGHILAGTIKDTVTRYAHQTGHYVSRRFGWDCHGLPIEYEIDKKLNITSRDQVLEMGIDKYNAECRGIVQRYTGEWESVVTRLGRWIDFKNDYRTMDVSFMESVWWVFKALHEKNLVYKGYRVMPYSTKCSTPLSNFEAGLNYKDVSDPAVVVSFPVEGDEASLVAWTTTPWTLPSNLALCVNAELDYVRVKAVSSGKIFIVAEARLVQLFPALGSKKFKKGTESTVYEIIAKMKGSDLVGLRYEPLFGFFDTPERRKTAFRVVSDGYVSADAGTGIVHQAPAFGEDDYRVCVANKIVDPSDVPCPVDADGRFTDEITDPDLQGQHVKEGGVVDAAIIAKLKAEDRLVVKEACLHSYPFCWRSDTPLIYRAVPSWFVAVESIKEKLLANNQKTYWVPSFVKEKRFHNWLADARDWNISRNRFWGTPIPLWVSDDGDERVAVGSVQELADLACVDASEITDLHREFIDKYKIPSKKKPGTFLSRVDAVFDCWFESGSMPYAQVHYPFENSDMVEKERFPADFIAEGLDQTRGWFYTLTVLGTALFDKPAFKNLIVNGLVLASDGKKMSKRLQNYPPPTNVIDAHGADALRLYLINSPVVKAESLRFTEDGVKGVLREVMLPWFNAYRFFSQQATRWEQQAPPRSFSRDEERAKASNNVMDMWIMANLDDLVNFVHDEMEAYRLYTVVPRLVGFLEDLTNWYVRLNRARLKGGDSDEDAQTSLAVMLEVLLKMATLMAPFTPFFAEFVYQRLRPRLPGFADKANRPADEIGAADSIHYVMLPPRVKSKASCSDHGAVLEGMRLLQRAVELGRRARDIAKITMKTPVKSVVVVSTDATSLEALKQLEPYLLGELNAWSVQLTADVDSWCSVSALPNLPVLGRRLGKRVGLATNAIKQLDSHALRSVLAENKPVDLELGGEKVSVCLEELLVKFSFSGNADDYAAQTTPDGSLTVAVETTQDDALLAQGVARELVNRVNKLRKKAKLAIGEPVDVFYDDPENNSTTSAISTNKALLDKANIVPVQATTRRHLQEIISDVGPTPFGSKSLRVSLCRPTPTIADTQREGAEALQGIVAAAQGKDRVTGTLDGKAFELVRGKDFFASATEKELAARASPAST